MALVLLVICYGASNYLREGTALVGAPAASSESSPHRLRRLGRATRAPRVDGGLPRRRTEDEADADFDAEAEAEADANAEAEEEAGIPCSDLKKANPRWLLTFYIIGVMYCFLALAIVCDEFFVPALEVMSSERHLNLSMDVAGATLMAAGGSAPELFTSLVGTFQESEVGVGTIVGSAVFNVLFVVACCSLFTKEALKLTWWPLFRDSIYYALGLIVLGVVVGVNTPGMIEVWEAAILLAMYFGYILVMAYNHTLYKLLTGTELTPVANKEDEELSLRLTQRNQALVTAASAHASAGGEAAPTSTNSDFNDEGSDGAGSDAGSLYGLSGKTPLPANAIWPGTFRAGVLSLLRDKGSWIQTGGVGIVSRLYGDAEQTFRAVDLDGDGSIDRNELEKLFVRLDLHLSETEMDEVFQQLDENSDGSVRLF